MMNPFAERGRARRAAAVTDDPDGNETMRRDGARAGRDQIRNASGALVGAGGAIVGLAGDTACGAGGRWKDATSTEGAAPSAFAPLRSTFRPAVDATCPSTQQLLHVATRRVSDDSCVVDECDSVPADCVAAAS